MAVRSRPRPAASRRAAPKQQKWVYLFANKKAEGNAKMRELLGGKGAGLAEMTNAGLPVPATAPAVREFQRRQAEVALPWAARELGLPRLRP